jgi:hypothetical protein
MKLISELLTIHEDWSWNPLKKKEPKENISNIDLLDRILHGKTFAYAGQEYKIDGVSWYSDPGLYKNSPVIRITGAHPSGEPHGDEKFLNVIRELLPRNIKIEYADYGMQKGFKMKLSQLADPDSPEYELLKKKEAKQKPQFAITVDMWVK